MRHFVGKKMIAVMTMIGVCGILQIFSPSKLGFATFF
jgi:hypothetical protein